MRREEAHGAVAPEVAEPERRRRRGDVLRIEREHRQELDVGDPERFEIRNFLDETAKRAGALDAGRRVARVARDVKLVDDGVVQRPLERPVALPVVVVGRRDLGAQRGRRIAVDRGLTVPNRVADEPRPRVEQLPARVEPQAGRRLVGPVGAPGVEPTGTRAGDERVPETERPVGSGIELDLGDRLGVGGAAVEAQPDARRARAEDGEVHAVAARRGAERLPRAGAHAELP